MNSARKKSDDTMLRWPGRYTMSPFKLVLPDVIHSVSVKGDNMYFISHASTMAAGLGRLTAKDFETKERKMAAAHVVHMLWLQLRGCIGGSNDIPYRADNVQMCGPVTSQFGQIFTFPSHMRPYVTTAPPVVYVVFPHRIWMLLSDMGMVLIQSVTPDEIIWMLERIILVTLSRDISCPDHAVLIQGIKKSPIVKETTKQ